MIRTGQRERPATVTNRTSTRRQSHFGPARCPRESGEKEAPRSRSTRPQPHAVNQSPENKQAQARAGQPAARVHALRKETEKGLRPDCHKVTYREPFGSDLAGPAPLQKSAGADLSDPRRHRLCWPPERAGTRCRARRGPHVRGSRSRSCISGKRETGEEALSWCQAQRQGARVEGCLKGGAAGPPGVGSERTVAHKSARASPGLSLQSLKSLLGGCFLAHEKAEFP